MRGVMRGDEGGGKITNYLGVFKFHCPDLR